MRRAAAVAAATTVLASLLTAGSPALADVGSATAVNRSAYKATPLDFWSRTPGIHAYGSRTTWTIDFVDIKKPEWPPIAGLRVFLYRSPRDKQQWTGIRTAYTDSKGRITQAVTLGTPFDYRAELPSQPLSYASLGATHELAVSRKLLLDSVAGGSGTIRATGRVFPAPPKGSAVYLQRWVQSEGVWRSIGFSRATGANGVTVAAKVGPSRLTYRLWVPASANYIKSHSNLRTFQQK